MIEAHKNQAFACLHLRKVEGDVSLVARVLGPLRRVSGQIDRGRRADRVS